MGNEVGNEECGKGGVRRSTKAEYVAKLEDDEFFRMSQGRQAAMMGVSVDTVKAWRQTIDWKGNAAKYRERYWYFGPQVDMAVIRKAMKGDLRAAELYYQRFEGWMPRSGVELSAGALDGKTNGELMVEYLSGMDAGERAKLLGLKDGGAGGVGGTIGDGGNV